jgi:hypothetical protein
VLTSDATGISTVNAECDLNEGIDVEDVTTLINYVLNGQW